ncbi:MAG: transposase [Acidobacteriota bacterium]
MARPKHRVKAAGAYFVTAETWQRRKLFNKKTTAKIVIDTLLDYRQRGFYRLHDFVVLPDHLHVILSPNGDTSLEKALQLIKGGSSYRIGQAFHSKFPVWQPGFHEHWIRSQEDYEGRRRYIELNPVKARLAAAPQEYSYSSANGHFDIDPFVLTSGAKAPLGRGLGSAGLKPRPAKTSTGTTQ